MITNSAGKKAKIAASFLIAVLMCFSFLPVSVFAENEVKHQSTKNEGMTVRVGFSEFQHFFEVDDDTGEYSGIIYEYMEEIAKYTGWKIKYINVPLEESYEMLEAGELDVLGGTLKNDDTMARFDFPEYNSGIRYSVLAVKSDNVQYSEFDYQSFQGMRVGMMSRAKQINGQFERFCLANGIVTQTVMYDDGSSCTNALQAGDVDAVLTNDIALMRDQRAVARFDETPYFFAVTKGKVEIIRGINVAISKILEMNPLFDSITHDKYIESNSDNDVILSATEKEYVKNMPTLRVAAISQTEPISYFGEYGEFMGITADVFKGIEERTGLQFEFVEVKTFAEAIEMTKSGKVDLVAAVPDNASTVGDSGIPLSYGYLLIRNVLVNGVGVNAQHLSGKTLALPKGYFPLPDFSDAKLAYFDNELECIRAVDRGEADFTVSSSYGYEWAIRSRTSANIICSSLPNKSYSISVGVGDPANQMLLAIIDKALHSISGDEIQNIVFENTAIKRYDVTLMDFIKANSLLAFLIVMGAAAIIFVISILMFRTRLKLSRQIAFDGERYRILGEIADEYIYEYDFKKKKFVLSGKLLHLFSRDDEKAGKTNAADNMPEQPLLTSFSKEKSAPNRVSEFQCHLASGESTWFRAVSTVIFDQLGAPVRGMGKLINIQNDKLEFQSLETRANTDSLTGLYTRQFCESDILKYYSQKQGRGTDCLMVIDIDHFKKINDTLGHLFGDKVLCELADTLKKEFEYPDLAGRWGGDEFIVFIKNIKDEQDIIVRAGYLCNMMHKEIAGENGISITMSLSIGICLSNNDTDFEKMFKHADNALYEVKAECKDGFKLYNTNEQETI